jgi:hypothetical protein
MNPDQRVKEAIRRLGADGDFQALLQYLAAFRNERLVELEDATVALQSHKLQGYCQALRDIAEMCARK